MAFEIGDKVGGYEVIGVLGAGGMGKVYKVRNLITDRFEAMKVLLPNLADESELADRFVREIKVLASLNHPRIAALYNALQVENQLVMIMEFVEGINLDDLSRLNPIPLRDCIHYISQVLAGLGYAHGKGVIHRDIKPGNMMLTPQGFIKIMDFGLAKSAADAKLTLTGETMGSPYYMSPEQVMGTKVDARSDLYSVGVSLYKLATGVNPFRGSGVYELMIAQTQQAPPPPIQVDPSIPPTLNEIILRALEKDPARRFQTAEEFRGALAGVLPAEATLPMQSVTPTPVTPRLSPEEAPSLVHPRAPIISRRSFYLAVGTILGIVLVVVLAIELPKINATHKREPGTGRVEGRMKATSKSLPLSLGLASGDMVLVEGGTALLGKDRHPVPVESFYVDKTEVTNRAFLEFCRATGLTPPKNTPLKPGDDPVVNVTFDEAQAFCRWAGKRLPTADEWEKAARGGDGRTYPWGETLDPERANIPKDRAAAKVAALAPATAYPSGSSPYGALNMLGNAWEWVNTRAEPPQGKEFETYQREEFPDLHPPLSPTEPYYQVRGGSYAFVAEDPSALIWDWSPVPERASTRQIGFRCAKDVDR